MIDETKYCLGPPASIWSMLLWPHDWEKGQWQSCPLGPVGIWDQFVPISGWSFGQVCTKWQHMVGCVEITCAVYELYWPEFKLPHWLCSSIPYVNCDKSHWSSHIPWCYTSSMFYTNTLCMLQCKLLVCFEEYNNTSIPSELKSLRERNNCYTLLGTVASIYHDLFALWTMLSKIFLYY